MDASRKGKFVSIFLIFCIPFKKKILAVLIYEGLGLLNNAFSIQTSRSIEW
jgi:hypothetical protein